MSPLNPNPLVEFKNWYAEVCNLTGPQKMDEMGRDAMVLSTTTFDGNPDARVVLFKGFEGDGFKFYTNYESRKGVELARDPRAALVFFWYPILRQVRVRGVVEKLSPEISDQYFASRARESQLGAWASDQSREVAKREILEQRFDEFQKKFEGKPVPRPPHWGGYRLLPNEMEFWVGKSGRLHDRFLYIKNVGTGEWRQKRLAP